MKTLQNYHSFLNHDPKNQQPYLNQTKSTLTFIKNSEDNASLQNKKKILKRLVSINTESFNRQIQIYNWRSKTELPISKVFCYKILPITTKNKVMLEVSYQAPLLKLSELQRLPLFQTLYLIKESLIGFQRLVNYVGHFPVTDRNIYLNKSYKCKVWWDEQFAQNKLLYNSQEIDQKLFLAEIWKIFEFHTTESKNSKEFYIQVKKIERFFQALVFIQNFSKQHRIIISNCLKLNQSFNRNSPNKMTVSKYIPSKQTRESFINTNKNYNMNCSLIKLQASVIGKTGTQANQFQKPIIPKFLSKKSLEQPVNSLSNPQMNANQISLLNKCRSYNYFRNLKQSTFTKLDKSKHEVDSSSFDGSNSQITTRSTKAKDKRNIKQHSQLEHIPKDNRKKNQYSFKKESPQKNRQIDKQIKNEFFDKDDNQMRLRKYSNDILLTKDKGYEYKGIKIINSPPIKEQITEESRNVSLENSIQANKKLSLQTLFGSIKAQNNLSQISNKHLNPQNEFKIKINNIKSIKGSTETTASLSKNQLNQLSQNQGPSLNIFQKNGWTMQIQSLMGNGKSIRESIKEGTQERSKYLGSTLDFVKLARLGRAIEGSMTPQDQFKNN